MKRWMISFLFVMFWCIGLWSYLYREVKVSGENFKEIAERSYASAYTSWFLYRQDEGWYCLRLSRPIVPQRFCVPKKDMEIRNAANGGSEKDFIYTNEWLLKKDRYPGAKEEIF